MKAIHFFLPAVFFLLIFSCNKSGNSDSTFKKDELNLITTAETDKAVSDGIIGNATSDTTTPISLQGTTPGQNPDWDKKIIKTAILKLEVKDFKQFSAYTCAGKNDNVFFHSANLLFLFCSY